MHKLSSAALLLVVVCTLAAHAQQTLRVAAAADLQPLLPGILSQFTAQTGIRTSASYNSSAVLATSIINGAPFDLFLAADLSFPQRVVAAGMAEEHRPVPYARGTLVLWTRNDTPFHRLSIHSLEDPSLKTLAIANPKHAPYGQAALDALQHLGLYPALQPKLVVAENIAQAAQYVDSSNAQLGMISLTAALTPRMEADGHYVLVPRHAYLPILQGAVVIRNSLNAQAANRFLKFLESPSIARELEARGLVPVH